MQHKIICTPGDHCGKDSSSRVCYPKLLINQLSQVTQWVQGLNCCKNTNCVTLQCNQIALPFPCEVGFSSSSNYGHLTSICSLASCRAIVTLVFVCMMTLVGRKMLEQAPLPEKAMVSGYHKLNVMHKKLSPSIRPQNIAIPASQNIIATANMLRNFGILVVRRYKFQ